jgi:ADP-ribose pyrophosphatase
MEPERARSVYRGEYLGVSLEVWNGREREIVERPDVVAIVAVDREGAVTLVRQVRPPARAALLEIPAGRVEAGESLLESARRELAEETGLRGGRWEPGPSFWTTPGFCRERVHLFFAEELEPGEPAPDDGEELELVHVPAGELEARLGEVHDGKSLVALLLYVRAKRTGASLSLAAGESGDMVPPP